MAEANVRVDVEDRDHSLSEQEGVNSEEDSISPEAILKPFIKSKEDEMRYREYERLLKSKLQESMEEEIERRVNIERNAYKMNEKMSKDAYANLESKLKQAQAMLRAKDEREEERQRRDIENCEIEQREREMERKNDLIEEIIELQMFERNSLGVTKNTTFEREMRKENKLMYSQLEIKDLESKLRHEREWMKKRGKNKNNNTNNDKTDSDYKNVTQDEDYNTQQRQSQPKYKMKCKKYSHKQSSDQNTRVWVNGLLLTTDCRNMFTEKNRDKINARDVTFEQLVKVIYSSRPADLQCERRLINPIKNKDSFPAFDGSTREELKTYISKFHNHAINSYGVNENRWLMELKDRIESSHLGHYFKNITTNSMSYPEYLELVIETIEACSISKTYDPRSKFADANLAKNEIISAFGLRLKSLYKRIAFVSDLETDPLLSKSFYSKIPEEIAYEIQKKCRHTMSATGEDVKFSQIMSFCFDVEKEVGDEKILELCRKFNKRHIQQGAAKFEWRNRQPSFNSDSSDETVIQPKNADKNKTYYEKKSNVKSHFRQRSKSPENLEDKKKAWQDRQKLKCIGCYTSGHLIETCFAKKVTCFKCQGIGYYAHMCKEKNSKKESPTASPRK